MAQAMSRGKNFTAKRIRKVRDEVSGLKSMIEFNKRVKT